MNLQNCRLRNGLPMSNTIVSGSPYLENISVYLEIIVADDILYILNISDHFE